MHSYSTDENRFTIVKKIGIISFLLSLFLVWTLNTLTSKFISLIHYSGKIPSISSIFIFGSLFAAFYYLLDRLAWKICVMGFSCSKIPNLSGEWIGHIKSSHKEGTAIDAKVKIEQTWTSISIILETEKSKSKSFTASILTSESRIFYHYLNEPKFTTESTMCIHYGVTGLDIKSNKELEGFYFTDRGRKTYGEIYLTKLSRSTQESGLSHKKTKKKIIDN